MTTQVALLRGINLGPSNRIAMPALREALSGAGHKHVRTYVQSGNVVLDAAIAPGDLSASIEALIAEIFGLAIPVVVRTRDELAVAIDQNPLPEATADPKRFQVSFCSAPVDAKLVATLQALAAPSERLAAVGRELYAWHPDGVARSKLWNGLAAKGGLGDGITTTTRNWTTVTTLLELADAT
jgi:uncharacterized protein (DUF1697 family)